MCAFAGNLRPLISVYNGNGLEYNVCVKTFVRAVGSVVERLVHTEEVTGSKPVLPIADLAIRRKVGRWLLCAPARGTGECAPQLVGDQAQRAGPWAMKGALT